MITKEQALKLARELGLRHGFDELDWVIDSDQLHALCQRVEEMALRKAANVCGYTVPHELGHDIPTIWWHGCRDAILAIITNQKEGT